MRRSAEAVLAVLIAAAVLPTAVEHQPFPRGVSSVVEREYNQRVADATWRALAISHSMAQPSVAELEPLGGGDWELALFQCVSAAGYPDIGLGYGTGDAITATDTRTGGPLEAAAELAFYRCAAVHPRDLPHSIALSDDQIRYLYSHLTHWLVPCLATYGYRVSQVPYYDTFVEAGGLWSPYWWGVNDPNGNAVDNEQSYRLMVMRCGQDWPAELRSS